AIPWFISCALGGETPTIFGDGEQARDFVFVDDVVQANLLAADAPEPAWGRAFNIGRGERRTVNELLDAIRTLVPGTHPSPILAPPRAGEVRDSWSDIGEARDALGYDPAVGFEEGLRRTIDWIARERAADLR
ncbi:MAG: NAD-dependent epimerase/dehydratase family protein, partial [Actinomycetota bacterium]